VTALTSPSILYVMPAAGGPPPEFTLPRLAAHGDVHALLFAAPSPLVDRILGDWCTSVHVLDGTAPMLDAIVATARRVRAAAVVAFSETAIAAVAAACEQLGLRGPGPNILLSRDKVLMRSTWRRAGLPGPAFVPVRSYEDLRHASEALRRPFLVKPSWLAGSIGQVLVDGDTDVRAAWRVASTALAEMDRAGVRDFMPGGRGAQFIAEEIIDSTTESWYDVDGYGDYLSVEGVVVAGRYHPLCITARLPTVPPFVELGLQVPTVLSVDAQRRVEDLARAAVDALGLDFCGTHTEMKLQRDGGLCLLENAARLGGTTLPRLIHDAFGVDLIDLVVRALLGRDAELPDRMITSSPTGTAVGTVWVFAADGAGRPWGSLPEFRPDRVDWRRLVAPDTAVEVVWSQSLPSGSPIPAFTATAGGRNSAGTLYLRAADPATLLADSHRIVEGMEEALSGVALAS
jgi:biotin carboxylase